DHPHNKMVKRFFKNNEWESMASIEQTRYHNIYKNYEMMIQLGMDAKPPAFVLRYRERQRQLLSDEKKHLQAASSSQDYTREASTSPDHIREASTSPDHTREASTSLDHTREEKPSPQILDGVEPREEGVTVTSFLSPRERTFKELYGCETENQEGMVEGSSFECDVDINDFDVRYTEDEMDTEENCAKRKLFFKDVKTEKSQSELNSLVKFTKSSFQDFADRGTVFQDYEMAGNQMMLDFAENSTKIMSKCLAISELSFNDSENGNSQNGLNSIEMSNKATFKCYECGHQFLQKSKIVSHLKTHTQEEHFECDECGQIFLESRLLKEHLFIMQELRSIRFINSQNMYFHCQTHTLEHNQKEPEDNVMVGRNPSSCLEYNGMTCNQTSQLMQVSRQPIRDMTSCHHPHQECHDTESEPTDHIDVGRLDDTQAGDVFMQSNHCEMEERTQTVGSPEENGCCIEQKKVKPAESVCDNSPYVIFKPFPMQKMMTNFGSQEYDHQSQVSSNLRQYHKIECKECNSQISGASNFRGHMLLHTGDRPFECKLCKAKFVRKDNLGRHMIRTHSTRQKTH
ncbi:Zinc finger protein 674-like, partial [Homarus americanus]